jgi:hypothetical protein
MIGARNRALLHSSVGDVIIRRDDPNFKKWNTSRVQASNLVDQE